MHSSVRRLSVLFLPALLLVAGIATQTHRAVAAEAVSRAEFVRMTLDAIGGFPTDGTHCFTDVTVQHYAPQVCAAKARGIVHGNPDGRFLPDQSVSFIEAAAIIVRARGVAVPGDSVWYRPYIRQLMEWKAVPASILNILHPLTAAQAQDLLRASLAPPSSAPVSGDPSDAHRDMRITLSSSTNRARIGERVTLTIVVQNRRNTELRTDVRAVLDDALTFVSATRGGWEDGRSVRWDDLRIAAQSTRELSVTVRIHDRAITGDALRVRAEADGLRVHRTIAVIGRAADAHLRLTVTDVDDPVRRLETITYRIRLQNLSSTTVTTDMRAVLDDRMDFVFAGDDGWHSSNEVRWSAIRLRGNETKTILLSARASSRARGGDTLRLRVEAGDAVVTETTRILH